MFDIDSQDEVNLIDDYHQLLGSEQEPASSMKKGYFNSFEEFAHCFQAFASLGNIPHDFIDEDLVTGDHEPNAEIDAIDFVNKGNNYLFDSHDEANHEPEANDEPETPHTKAGAPSDDNPELKDSLIDSYERASAPPDTEVYVSAGIPPSIEVLDFSTEMIGQFDGNESVTSITF